MKSWAPENPPAGDQPPSAQRPRYIGNYQLGKTLGQGSYGKVKLATHQLTGEKVAIKILDKQKLLVDPLDCERINREIRIMKKLHHPNTIRLYEVIDTSKHLFMIQEYCSGGELFDYIVSQGNVSEKEARKFFRQVISGMDYCHRKNIIHRDLKPENIMLDDDLNVKIVDFGFSNIAVPGHTLQTYCGSPAYAAPEMISGHAYFGPEVDIWSLGVILYALVCGRLPFDHKNITKLYQLILKGDYHVPDHLSPECVHLISRLLTVTTERRASMEEILIHPWVNFGFQTTPDVLCGEEDVIDVSLVKEAEKIGFDYEYVMKSLGDGEKNQATATYWLLHDKLRREKRYSSMPTIDSLLSSRRSISFNQSPKFDQLLNPLPSPASSSSGFDYDSLASERSNERSHEKLPAIHEKRKASSTTPGHSKPTQDEAKPMSSRPNFYKLVIQDLTTSLSPRPPPAKDSAGPSSARRRYSTSTPRQRPSVIQIDEEANPPSHVVNPSPRTKASVTPRRKFSLPSQAQVLAQANPAATKTTPSPVQEEAHGPTNQTSFVDSKDVLNWSASTSKADEDIIGEIRRVLDANSIAYKDNRKTIECEHTPSGVTFEMEVYRHPTPNEHHSGVKFRRLNGEVWVYTRLCQKLSSEFRL